MTVCVFIVFPVLVAAGLVFLGWSCASVSSGVWTKTVCNNLEPGKTVLTFDDGPDPSATPRILDILKENNVHAYFFVTGDRAVRYPELIRRMVLEGHTVGNHTFHHSPLFPLSGVPCMVAELQACDSAVSSALEGADVPSGVLPGARKEDHPAAKSGQKLFRPPFGVTNPDVARALVKTGHTAVGWDIRSYDTIMIKDGMSPEKAGKAVRKCVRRILRRMHPGAVVLLHDRLEYSPMLLQELMDGLRKGEWKLA